MSYIEKYSINSPEDAIRFLHQTVGGKPKWEDAEGLPSAAETPAIPIEEVLITTHEIKSKYPDTQSWEMEYWLGKGLSWCGEHFSSIEHFERAYRLSEGILENHIPQEKKNNDSTLDRNDIAAEIGYACVKIEHSTYLTKAIQYLTSILNHCNVYHPGIEHLMNAYYKASQYTEAAQTAEEALNRVKKDSYWLRYRSPNYFLNFISKCYSTESLKYRDQGDIPKVVEILHRAKEKGFIKAQDESMLKRLQQQDKILFKEKSTLNQILLSESVIRVIRRELKDKYPDVLFDFMAVKKALEERIQTIS